PLGVFLSGGIDSSAVLAYACANAAKGNVHTYSIGFHEPTFDESGYARDAARRLGSIHHEEILDIERARELAPEVRARPDELFAGYDPFRALGVARWYNALVPAWMQGGIRKLADWLPVSDDNMSLDFRIRRGLQGASFAPAMWNPAWLGPLTPREVADVLGEPVAAED